jgi:Superinfection exclusion gene product 17
MKMDTLKVWWIPNPPRKGFTHAVQSVRDARLILEALAQYDLYLGDDVVFANAGGLVINDDGEEWEDENGNDVWETDTLHA